MKTKFTLSLVVFLIVGLNAFAQFNNYKYVIIPKKFDAYKEQNKHQTSTTIKYFLTQKGFNTVYDDALPEDLARNRCLGLRVDLQDDSSFFTTKATIIFKDCNSEEVFRTIEGKSKLKEYKPAYTQAIRNALVSLNDIDNTYIPKEEKPSNEETVTLNFKNDVKTLKEDSNEVILEQKATLDNQTYKAIKPKPALFTGDTKSEVLYAQPIQNGYQLVDSVPKIRYKLVESSIQNLYLVEEGDKKGIIFQKEGKWLLEYVENGIRVVEELNIKF